MLPKKYFYISTGLVITLIGIRFFYTGCITYMFLLWNLFLAWLPFTLSRQINSKHPLMLQNYALLTLWLLFLPNAPYIITDLMHIKHIQGMPIYFDIILILTTTLQGLVYFYTSIYIVKTRMIRHMSTTTKKIFVPAVFVLSGWGIYLGRYGRYNSWDIVTHPNKLLYHIINSIIHPIDNANQWKVCLFFTLFFIIILSAIQYAKQFFAEHNWSQKPIP
jgi:uncharacterized membrane protein